MPVPGRRSPRSPGGLDDDEEDYPGARGARRLLLAQNKNPTPTRAKATAKAKAKAKAKATTTAAAATPLRSAPREISIPTRVTPGGPLCSTARRKRRGRRASEPSRGATGRAPRGTSSRVSAWLGAVARVVGLGARRSLRVVERRLRRRRRRVRLLEHTRVRLDAGLRRPRHGPPHHHPRPLRRCVRRRLQRGERRTSRGGRRLARARRRRPRGFGACEDAPTWRLSHRDGRRRWTRRCATRSAAATPTGRDEPTGRAFAVFHAGVVERTSEGGFGFGFGFVRGGTARTSPRRC